MFQVLSTIKFHSSPGVVTLNILWLVSESESVRSWEWVLILFRPSEAGNERVAPIIPCHFRHVLKTITERDYLEAFDQPTLFYLCRKVFSLGFHSRSQRSNHLWRDGRTSSTLFSFWILLRSFVEDWGLLLSEKNCRKLFSVTQWHLHRSHWNSLALYVFIYDLVNVLCDMC